jgi:Protein of unknown function (DUF3617)
MGDTMTLTRRALVRRPLPKGEATVWLFTLAAIVIALPAHAAERLTAGEWEVTVKVSQRGGMQVPTDQPEEIKKLGIPIPLMGQTVVASQCITPEMATADKPFNTDERDPNKCQLANYKRVGNKATGEMVCTGEFKGKGPFEMSFDSETEYRGAWTVTGVSDSLGQVEQTTEVHGKWARPACDPNTK